MDRLTIPAPLTDAAPPAEGPAGSHARLRWLATMPMVWLGTIGLVALADYASGPEWSFGAIYMVPVLGVAYFLTRRWVVVVAVLCSLAWLAVDLSTNLHYSRIETPFWNAFTRLAMFGVAGLLLHQVRALQSREKALMQFVVHDLRNPLMALDLSLQRLAETQVAVESQAAFKASKHLIRRSQGLLDALLELARLEVGARPVDTAPFSMAPLLEDVMATFRFVQEHTGIHIRIEDDSGQVRALGDARLTERVIENVLGNAIKASPRGKTITIRLSPPAGGYLNLSVADQGAGVPAPLRERVFDTYVQGAGVPDGMGLGLSFCRVAVQAMRGRIWMECPGEGGTIVTISLPAEAR